MRIYAITPLGRAVARSTSASRVDQKQQVLDYLNKVTRSTPDRIAQYTGVGGSVMIILRDLQASRFVIEESRVRV